MQMQFHTVCQQDGCLAVKQSDACYISMQFQSYELFIQYACIYLLSAYLMIVDITACTPLSPVPFFIDAV
jgi:hypothetical protein